MMDDKDVFVRKLEIAPGDILVVNLLRHIPLGKVVQLTDWIKENIPDTKVVIVPPEIELSILSPKELGDLTRAHNQ